MTAYVSLYFRSQRLCKSRTLASMLQLLLAASVLNSNVSATPGPEMGANLDPESVAAANDGDSLMLGYDEAKRSWQSLQGGWGKRTPASGGSDAWRPEHSADADADAAYFAEHWMPLLMNSVRGAGNELGGDQQPPKYTLVYLTSAAALDHLANQQRHAEEAAAAQYNSGDLLNSSQEESDDGRNILNEKRTWKNMNAAWGKRRNAPAWNKFRGAWGKREPGWNNLKGMWGKRSSKDWQKLHGGWGKRAEDMN